MRQTIDEGRELPWLPGARYALEAFLGSGGTAEVFRAFDHDTKQWCAVKLLHERHAKSEKARRRFLDEAVVLNRLDHRNVIHVRDVVGDAARPFLVMELAEGGSLMDWTRAHGPMPPRMAVDLAIQICKGVGAAHKINVIHRDVKPHNILLTRRGVAKVTDFGIAQLPRTDGTTDVPDAVDPRASGTIGYMAPEQRKDPRLVDPRTDIYSTGATLYTLLTAETVTDLFIAERESELLDPVPEVLRPVLLKAISYQREDRFMTMPDVAKALFDLRQELPPDPYDAPPLVEGDVTTNLEPPPRPEGEPPTPVSLDTGVRMKPATTPPTQLRTATPAPGARAYRPEPPKPSPLRHVPAMAAVVVLLVMAIIGFGAWQVRSSASEHANATRDFYRALDLHLAIVDDLSALGSDGSTLEAGYRAQRDASTDTRGEASRHYVQMLRQEMKRFAATRSPEAASARERLGMIEAELDDIEAAESAWAENATGIPGSLSVALGLASAP